jgi:DNA-binding NarL/FixJ family response regulator
MKILIADDHDLVRETLAAFLERETDIDVYTPHHSAHRPRGAE